MADLSLNKQSLCLPTASVPIAWSNHWTDIACEARAFISMFFPVLIYGLGWPGGKCRGEAHPTTPGLSSRGEHLKSRWSRAGSGPPWKFKSSFGRPWESVLLMYVFKLTTVRHKEFSSQDQILDWSELWPDILVVTKTWEFPSNTGSEGLARAQWPHRGSPSAEHTSNPLHLSLHLLGS